MTRKCVARNKVNFCRGTKENNFLEFFNTDREFALVFIGRFQLLFHVTFTVALQFGFTFIFT